MVGMRGSGSQHGGQEPVIGRGRRRAGRDRGGSDVEGSGGRGAGAGPVTPGRRSDASRPYDGGVADIGASYFTVVEPAARCVRAGRTAWSGRLGCLVAVTSTDPAG